MAKKQRREQGDGTNRPGHGRKRSKTQATRTEGSLARPFAEAAERTKTEEALRQANERLQTQAEELQNANEELNAQTEELAAQAEELRTSEQALRESEQRYRSLFENMLDGYAYCQMLFDNQGRPADFIYLNVNEAFGRLTGLENVIGRKVTEVIPAIRESHPELLETYGRVATTGRAERFELESKPLGIWLSISVYSSLKGHFTAVFDNITERKHAEEGLTYLASFPQHNPNPVMEVDLDGGIRYANAATLRLFPDLYERGPNHPWLTDWPAVVRPFRDGQTDASVRDLTIGERTYHQAFYYFAQDRFVHIYAFDITDRKRVEQALRESEQRLRLAMEGGQMGLWEWDLRTDASFWDQRVYELLGLETSAQAGIGTFLDCVLGQDKDAVKKLIQEAITGQMDVQAEFRVRHHRELPRGEILWLALRSRVVRDQQGQGVRMIGVLYDVTQRKQMEAELRRMNEKLEEEVHAQTEELRDTIDRLQDEVVRRVLAEGKLRKNSRMLEAFFRHTITPLAFMDKHFNFIRVNEAYAKADNQPPEFFVRKNHFVLYPHRENRAIFERVVRTKKPYYAYAKPFTYANSPERGVSYWNWQLTPLLNDHGEVEFLVLNLENVTERQKATHELQQRAHQLQKLTLELSQAEDRERRRLAAILHDDLQQVLAAVKFHLGLLNNHVKSNAPAKELTDQLSQMLREAIDKSRSLSHELSPAVLYQTDLGETFEWLARQVRTKHGLTVHAEIHGRVDSASEAIKAFLFRAAQEILFNAVKHAKVTEARLRLQRRRGQLWLTIADQGCGFDPNALGRTAGFGLFSIRERVELLGGRMKIHSVKGRGSVFLIAITDAEEENGEQRAEDRELTRDTLVPPSSVLRRPSSGLRLRVLLADDHKVMRQGLATLIAEQADMEVIGQAGDGDEAVALARELLPDVVIMDVAMPKMPGDEATRQIKVLLPQTRIVALSMFEESGVAHRMLDAGAEVYLPKTGPSENLLAAIRGH